MSITGRRSWDPTSPANQFDPAKASGADCVVLAGRFDGQVPRMLTDKTAVLTIEAVAKRGEIGRFFLQDFAQRHGHDLRFASGLYAVQALQVILDAILYSDGDRSTVRQSAFLDDGVRIKADNAVLGADVHISPVTGDGSPLDYTIFIVEARRAKPSQAVSG